jgi:hypothetical protein
MNCIVEINGREAVPVRAIPYITGWSLSPDRVASGLAQSSPSKRLSDLRAHHISPDGSIGEMLPKEWDGIEDKLEALHLELEEKNPDCKITRPEWLERSVPLLPSHCFVWRDEFEEKYRSGLEGIFFFWVISGQGPPNLTSTRGYRQNIPKWCLKECLARNLLEKTCLARSTRLAGRP